MNDNEVGVADDIASEYSFTRQLSLNLEVELLRILFQQALLRRRGRIRLQEVTAEARLDSLYECIAAVIGRSYAERGDAATIKDDEALMLIRELLLREDEAMINMYKNMRLPRYLLNILSGL